MDTQLLKLLPHNPLRIDGRGKWYQILILVKWQTSRCLFSGNKFELKSGIIKGVW